jgi:hypothetical protein
MTAPDRDQLLINAASQGLRIGNKDGFIACDIGSFERQEIEVRCDMCSLTAMVGGVESGFSL